MQIFNQKKDERIYVFLSKKLKDELLKFKKSSGMGWDATFFHLCTTIQAPDSYQTNYITHYSGQRDKLLNIYISALTLKRFNLVNALFVKMADCIDYLMFEQSKKTPFDDHDKTLFSSNI